MFFNILNYLKGMLFFTGSYSVNVFPPPLSKSIEEECIIKMKNGDMDARNKLIEHNLRLVAHLVKKYENKDISSDDLISIGTIGLIKGIESYQYGKGSLLATYVARCIDNEILMYIRANKKHRNNLSLSDAVGVDKDGNEITLMDVIPSDDENGFLKIEDSVVMEKVKKIISEKLTKREKKIINLRYGLEGGEPKTQLEVSEILNISRSYVSRLEKKIIAKIGKYL